MPATSKVRPIALLLLALFALSASASAADSAAAVAAAINQTGGVALKGYDPVAYFTEGKAVQGSDQFSSQYQGATYKFESAANRDAFVANPAKYAPQYGGYCAYGVAHGDKADVDPDAFTVVNGKLYMNYNKAVRFLWKRNIPGNITKADQNWPDLSKATDAAK
jgi:YHS domain-containing protein